MDLRGFTAERRGAEFELHQLAARTNAGRIVLIVDDKTDRALLAAPRPARKPPAAMEVRRGSGRQADAAFAALLAAAG